MSSRAIKQIRDTETFLYRLTDRVYLGQIITLYKKPQIIHPESGEKPSKNQKIEQQNLITFLKSLKKAKSQDSIILQQKKHLLDTQPHLKTLEII